MANTNLSYIASVCGVSTMTVRRALRNDPGVADATRDLVMRAAKEMNYVPLPSRKTNGNGRSKQYYVVFHKDNSLKDSFFRDVILNIQRDLFGRGYGCSLGVVQEQYSEFIELHNIMSADNVRGILVVGNIPVEYLRVLLESFPNVVLVDHPGDAIIYRPYNAIVYDQFLGSCMAVDHLLKLGRKRILLVNGPEKHYFSMQLLAGYRDTLASHGIEFDPHLVVAGDFHIDGGREAVKRALEAKIDFDAVFTNDEMACGAIKALKSAGVRIPEDVSLVGFDGLLMGTAVSPSLTTVAIDGERMGRLAVDRILSLDDEQQKQERFFKISLFPKLVIRHSCGGLTA